jgi:hypothetical protein
LISTLTIIFDIGWLSDAIFGANASQSGAANAAQLARYPNVVNLLSLEQEEPLESEPELPESSELSV